MSDGDADSDRAGLLAQINIRWIVGGTIALVAVGLAVVIVLRDGSQLLTYSLTIDPLLLFVSFLVECSSLFVTVFVWGRILNKYDIRLGYWSDFRIYSYSLIGAVLPGRIWTTVGRVALYDRQKVDGLPVATASVAEFIILGLAGVLVFGLSSLAQPSTDVWLNPSISIAIVGFSILMIQPPIFSRLSNLLFRLTKKDRFSSIRLTYGDLVSWLILNGVAILIAGTAVYVLFRGVFANPPDNTFWPIVSAWAIATISGNLLFWLPGTPIIRDGVMALILAQWLPAEVSIVFVLVVRVWTIASIIALILIVGLIFERGPGQRLRPNNPL